MLHPLTRLSWVRCSSALAVPSVMGIAKGTMVVLRCASSASNSRSSLIIGVPLHHTDGAARSCRAEDCGQLLPLGVGVRGSEMQSVRRASRAATAPRLACERGGSCPAQSYPAGYCGRCRVDHDPLFGTAWLGVRIRGCLIALGMHVLYARLCCVLRGRHPGPGTPDRWKRGRGQSRRGHTGSAFNPALGPGCKPIRFAETVIGQAHSTYTSFICAAGSAAMLLR